MLVIITIIEIFINCLTILLAKNIDKKNQLEIKSTLRLTFQKYPNLLLSNAILSAPILVLFLIPLFAPLKMALILLLIIPLSIILKFLSIIIALENYNLVQSFILTLRFIKTFFSKIILFVLLFTALTTSSLALSLLFLSIPIVGITIFQALTVGFFSCYLKILEYFFYKHCYEQPKK